MLEHQGRNSAWPKAPDHQQLNSWIEKFKIPKSYRVKKMLRRQLWRLGRRMKKIPFWSRQGLARWGASYHYVAPSRYMGSGSSCTDCLLLNTKQSVHSYQSRDWVTDGFYRNAWQGSLSHSRRVQCCGVECASLAASPSTRDVAGPAPHCRFSCRPGNLWPAWLGCWSFEGHRIVPRDGSSLGIFHLLWYNEAMLEYFFKQPGQN